MPGRRYSRGRVEGRACAGGLLCPSQRLAFCSETERFALDPDDRARRVSSDSQESCEIPRLRQKPCATIEGFAAHESS